MSALISAISSVASLLLTILKGAWGFALRVLARRPERVLHLNHKRPIDIVLTTTKKIPHEAENIPREVTTLGNVKAASFAVSVIPKRASRAGRINLELSGSIDHPTAEDLIVIGGPKQNTVAKSVLRRLQTSQSFAIEFDDADQKNARLKVGEFETTYSIEMQDHSPAHPKEDYALAVLWVNPLAKQSRRLVWCAGFTSSGTSAAAEYLFNEVLSEPFWKRARNLPGENPHRSRKLKPRPWRWCCFVMVLHIEFNGASPNPTEVSVLKGLERPQHLPVASQP